jgi:hypothetical protein
MPYNSAQELLSYVPYHLKSDLTDPLVYARFYSETESFYVLEYDGTWYGYRITEENAELTYVGTAETASMKWDTTFTPCPLSLIESYITRY